MFGGFLISSILKVSQHYEILSKFLGSAFTLTLMNSKFHLETVPSCSSLSSHHWWVCPPAQVRSPWGSLLTFCLGGRNLLLLLFPSILRQHIHECQEHSSPMSVWNTERTLVESTCASPSWWSARQLCSHCICHPATAFTVTNQESSGTSLWMSEQRPSLG